MDDATAKLIVRQGPNPNVEYELAKTITVIGRTQENDIALADPEVSRQHAHIIRRPGGFSIEDLGSSNGTFVNGLRTIGMTPLNHGDRIELGEAILLVFLGQPGEGVATSPEPLYAQQSLDVSSGEPTAPLTPDVGNWEDTPSRPFDRVPTKRPDSNRKRWILGCGCGFLLAIFLCTATLFFLDAYEGGRLLYCGPAQPLFETLLGPFGFSPACALG